MKVRIKILWQLKAKNIEIDGLWQNVAKSRRTSVALKELRTDWATFLASFRERDKLSVVWFVVHHDLVPDHERSFAISSYASRNRIITTL